MGGNPNSKMCILPADKISYVQIIDVYIDVNPKNRTVNGIMLWTTCRISNEFIKNQI